MDLSKKYTKELRQVKIKYRSWLFPYVTKFMDKRLDSYLSLFYECENYTLEEFKQDLCDVLLKKQPFAIQPFPNREPIFTQLTLF